MSDTANPPALASADDFDARLKRTDEDRWLATRYAPDGTRPLLVALYLYNQELQRTLTTKEAMVGKIRLQWWRETVEQIAGAGPVRRHDLAEELARLTRDRRDLIGPMNSLIDVFDDVLDDHLHAGGHQASADHERRHLAVEGSLMRLAGLALDPGAQAQHLDAMVQAAEGRLSLAADIPDASKRWAAAKVAVRAVPTRLWPALLHLAAAQDTSALGKRWRLFSSALRRRL